MKNFVRFFLILYCLKFNRIIVIKIYEDKPNFAQIKHVVEVLRNGGVIIIPTDTVYAFACDIFNNAGVEFINKIKNRDPRKSNLSFVCYEMSQVSEYAKLTDGAFKIMRKNLPGPFTFILQGNNRLPKLFKNRKNVGIRIPNNNIVLEIVKELGNPIMTSSILTSGEYEEYYTDPELIRESFDNKVDLVIDGGFGGVVHSTVVDCSDDEIVIIREGAGILQL